MLAATAFYTSNTKCGFAAAGPEARRLIDCCTAGGRRSASAAPQYRAQQQMRAVPRCQPRDAADHRLALFDRVEDVRLFFSADEAHDGQLSTRRHHDGRPLRQDASSHSGSFVRRVPARQRPVTDSTRQQFIALDWQPAGASVLPPGE